MGKQPLLFVVRRSSILKHSIDHNINSPSDILPFTEILGESLDVNCNSDQIRKHAPVCSGLTVPNLKEQIPN